MSEGGRPLANRDCKQLDSLLSPASMSCQMVRMGFLRVGDLRRSRALVGRVAGLDFLTGGVSADSARAVESMIRNLDILDKRAGEVLIVHILDVYGHDAGVMPEHTPLPTSAGET